MNYFPRITAPPHWLWQAGALLALLGLAGRAQAQNSNTGTARNVGSLYQAAAFINTSTGNFANVGSAAVVYYAGPSAATFTNNGTYAGTASAIDQFIGPAGAAGPQTLAGSTAPSFYTLNLANGSSSRFDVTNPAGADVANQLQLNNGITTTTGNTVPTATANTVAGAIRLAAAATVGGSTPNTARYVDGFVGKAGTTSFTYPLGAINAANNGGNTTAAGTSIYSPITLSSPGGTAIRYVAANTPNNTVFATQGGGLQLTNVSAREYYPIGTVGAASGSTITIPYNNFGATAVGNPYVGDPSTLTIAGYDGTRWINLSAVVSNAINTTAKTVTVTLPVALNINYTALTLASISPANPLPVQLVAFTVQAVQGRDALLKWTTASELRNDHFELERSLDGTTFSPVGRVAGQGSKATATDYTFTDAGIGTRVSGLVYYRLKQVDLDGTASYAGVRTVSFSGRVAVVSLYPNPVRSATGLDLSALPGSQTYSLTLLDATGRLVRQVTLAGGQVHPLDLADVASGAYSVLVTGQQADGTALRQVLRVVKE